MICTIIRKGGVVRPTSHTTLCRNSKDNIFLELGVDDSADDIIRGDQDLIPIGKINITHPHCERRAEGAGRHLFHSTLIHS